MLLVCRRHKKCRFLTIQFTAVDNNRKRYVWHLFYVALCDQHSKLWIILTGILTGLVLSSNGICLNTQLSVKVNIFSFANIGVPKLWIVKWGFMIKFYFEVCPTFIESLFKTHDVWCIYKVWRKTIPDVDNTNWEEPFSDVKVCVLYKQLEVMTSCCWKFAFL